MISQAKPEELIAGSSEKTASGFVDKNIQSPIHTGVQSQQVKQAIGY